MDIYEQIKAERYHQDRQHGGPKHDDTHTHEDWMNYRKVRENRLLHWEINNWATVEEKRKELIVIAALAVAEIESLERKEEDA